MEGPRCYKPQPDPPGADCVSCGIVFSKWVARQDASAPDSIQPASISGATLAGLALLFVGFFLWSWRFITQPIGTAALDSFLHLPNLVFHEAGHIIFRPFGTFMTELGGSLMQLLIPTLCLAAFLWQNRDPFAASLALWWLGENFLDLAPYIGDARKLELVLLGGFTGREVEGHDWEAILGALGWLAYDRTLGRSAAAVSVALMIGALVGRGVVLLSQFRRASQKRS